MWWSRNPAPTTTSISWWLSASTPIRSPGAEGRSKKMAEQHAAREALKLLGVIKEK